MVFTLESPSFLRGIAFHSLYCIQYTREVESSTRDQTRPSWWWSSLSWICISWWVTESAAKPNLVRDYCACQTWPRLNSKETSMILPDLVSLQRKRDFNDKSVNMTCEARVCLLHLFDLGIKIIIKILLKICSVVLFFTVSRISNLFEGEVTVIHESPFNLSFLPLTLHHIITSWDILSICFLCQKEGSFQLYSTTAKPTHLCKQDCLEILNVFIFFVAEVVSKCNDGHITTDCERGYPSCLQRECILFRVSRLTWQETDPISSDIKTIYSVFIEELSLQKKQWQEEWRKRAEHPSTRR